MSNVLPESAKKMWAAGARARFLTTFGVVSVASACVGFFVLLPAFLFVYTETMAIRAVAELESGLGGEGRADAARVRALTEVLGGVGATSTVSQALVPLLAHAPSGVSLRRIEFRRDQGFSLVGSARKEGLNEYRVRVAGDTERFSSVSVPVSALVGAASDRFTMTVRLVE